MQETMVILSEGFSTGIAAVWIACWTASFGFFAYAGAMAGVVSNIRVVLNILISLATAAAPLALVLPLARVGTRCDDLQAALNDKAMRHCMRHLEFHERLNALELRLRRLNNQQGLGFCVGGVVLDKRTLIKIFVGIASLTGTIGPAVMLLTPQPTVGDANECALTEAVRPRVSGRLAPSRRLTPCCMSVQETASVRSFLDSAIALVVSYS